MDNKPLEVLMLELKNNLINDINKSGLPLSISVILLKEIYDVVKETESKETSKIVNEYYNKIEDKAN